MTEFTRENRYLVFKISRLTPGEIKALRAWMTLNHIEPIDGMVIERDWPEYETKWREIEARVCDEKPHDQIDRLRARLRSYEEERK